jgi:hypothetical protein
MTAALTNVRADNFLKAWWTSRQGRVQNPQLFARFKELVSSRSAAVEVSRDLLLTSEKYAAFEVADDQLWSRYSEKARERVRNLKLLGAQQAHPVLLSALDKFSVRELERLLHLLEILIVRYQLVGGRRTGRLETASARLAYQIFKEECTTASQAAALVKDIFPNDDEFREDFRTKQETNNQKARYLLMSLEIQARRRANMGTAAAEFDPSKISLTVEHIFPKSPGEDWRDLQNQDPEFADDYTYRLGNLCLLTDVNRALGNKAFDRKKETFAKSGLLLTRSASEFAQWDRIAVENRQERMARLAVTFWRFDS